MNLTQSDKLEILAMTGNHQDDQGAEPLTDEGIIYKDNESPLPAETWAPFVLSASGPRFPYSTIRNKIKDRSLHTPTQSKRTPLVEYDECSEPDMYGTHCERVAIESADYLPSMRDRRAIHSELASMGCTWGE